MRRNEWVTIVAARSQALAHCIPEPPGISLVLETDDETFSHFCSTPTARIPPRCAASRVAGYEIASIRRDLPSPGSPTNSSNCPPPFSLPVAGYDYNSDWTSSVGGTLTR
jgi:hypothetical protein